MRSLLQTAPGTAEEAMHLLASGAVVILPTDTLYGFSGIVPAADGAIRAIKGRSETKPFIQLLASPEDIARHSGAPIPPELLKYWPGPLTIVVPVKANDTTGTGSTSGIAGTVDTVAFRVPGDPWLRALLADLGRPLYSTSVNRAGTAPLTDPGAIAAEFAADVPLMVRAGTRDGSLCGPPSTVVAVTATGYTVLRKGAISL